MRRLSLVLFGLLLIAPLTHAQTKTGEQMEENCKKLAASDTSPGGAAFDAGHCAGFIEGVINTQQFLEVADQNHAKGFPQRFCLPENVTNDQTLKVFLKFLNDHPERLHESAVVLLIESLAQAFPCSAR